MYLSKDIMLVSQNSGHNGVCQCNLRLTALGAAAAAPAGAPAGRQRHEKSYRRNELCAFVAKCTNEYANQRGTALDFYTMSAQILQSVKLQFPKCSRGPFNKGIPDELRKRLWT